MIGVSYLEMIKKKVVKRRMILKINDETLPPKVSYSTEENLDSYEVTEMDLKLAEVFDSEYIHKNDGSHLDSGKDIIIYPLQQHNIPS